MDEPKVVTVAEVLLWQTATKCTDYPDAYVAFDRLLATAQAAAEADSLRAQLEEAVKHATDEEAQKWTATTERDALRAQLEEARKSFADFQELKRNKCPTHAGARVACRQCHDSLKQHLTAAQGEVAVLREALRWSLRRLNDHHHDDHDPKRKCPGCAALASPRATAAAHDERVRREALEEAAGHAEDFTCINCGHDTRVGNGDSRPRPPPPTEEGSIDCPRCEGEGDIGGVACRLCNGTGGLKT